MNYLMNSVQWFLTYLKSANKISVNSLISIVLMEQAAQVMGQVAASVLGSHA